MRCFAKVLNASFFSTIGWILFTAGGTGVSLTAAASDDIVIEEIIVSARKRQESLQETPIAITVLTGDQLTAGGLRDISDLRIVVPNVDVYRGNGANGAGNVFIRGVGARNTGVNFDSGVGIYLDNVYLSRPDGSILDNVDIQALEVLRGPQGTLFGKNSTGGAILYSTNKPSDELEGNVEIRGGNYQRRDAKLTVNIPLIDEKLFSRFSMFSTQRDGYVYNPVRDTTLSDEDRIGGQAHLLWIPRNDLIIDFNSFYGKVDQQIRGQDCITVDNIEGAGWQAALQEPNVIFPSTGQTIADSCRDNQDLGQDVILSDFDSDKYRAETKTGAISVDWEFSDTMSFKSITAIRTTDSGGSSDLDGTAIPLLHRTNYGWTGAKERETVQLSQEFQVSGEAFDDQLNFVVGVYAFNEKSDSGRASSPTGPFFGVSFTPFGDPFPPLAFYINNQTELSADNSSYSAYSQADWNFNDSWTATLGLRFTQEDRELTRIVDAFDPDTVTLDGSEISDFGSGVYLFPNGIDSYNRDHGYAHVEIASDDGNIADINNQTKSISNSSWTPMASVQYLFEDIGIVETGSIYFTVANGFLSGGISESLDFDTQELTEYLPEDVWNYELGFKMDAFDRRFRLNTALFYMDYGDRQLTSVRVDPITGRIAGVTINAKESSIAGVEIETTFIPIPNLEVNANITFNEGKIKTYEDVRIVTADILPSPGCTAVPKDGDPTNTDPDNSDIATCEVDRSDENLPRLPERIYFLSLQYTFSGEFGVIIPRIQWSLREDVDNCFDRSSCVAKLYLVDQESLDARLTWKSPEEDWRVTAYGSNLTDERYIIGGTPLVDVTETAGRIASDPRMYGVEVSYSW